MNKLKAITDIYNSRQDKYRIRCINKNVITKNFDVEFEYKKDDEYRDGDKYGVMIHPIGFYEWLINPKYGVMEVFVINYLMLIDKSNPNKSIVHKSAEEIVDYLYNEVKHE